MKRIQLTIVAFVLAAATQARATPLEAQEPSLWDLAERGLLANCVIDDNDLFLKGKLQLSSLKSFKKRNRVLERLVKNGTCYRFKSKASLFQQNDLLFGHAMMGQIQNCQANIYVSWRTLKYRLYVHGEEVALKRSTPAFLANELRKQIEAGNCSLPEQPDWRANKVASLPDKEVVRRISDSGDLSCSLEKTAEYFGVLSIQGGQRKIEVYLGELADFGRYFSDCRRILVKSVEGFQEDSIGTGFLWAAETVYKPKREFLKSAAETVGACAQVDSELNRDEFERLMGRLFVLNAVKPVIMGTDSKHFIEEVQPSFLSVLNQLNTENSIGSIRDIYPVPSVLKSALSLLNASVREAKRFLSGEHQEALSQLQTTIGSVLAKKIEDRRDLEPVVAELEKCRKALEAIASSRHTQEFGQVAQSIAEYLKRI